jgi:hypothetical protein
MARKNDFIKAEMLGLVKVENCPAAQVEIQVEYLGGAWSQSRRRP